MNVLYELNIVAFHTDTKHNVYFDIIIYCYDILLNQSKGAAQIHFKIIKRLKTNNRFLNKCIYYYTTYVFMKINLCSLS